MEAARQGLCDFPTASALSLDEKSLFFCVSDPAHPVYLKYDIQPDGNIANGKVFFDTHSDAGEKAAGPA